MESIAMNPSSKAEPKANTTQNEAPVKSSEKDVTCKDGVCSIDWKPKRDIFSPER